MSPTRGAGGRARPVPPCPPSAQCFSSSPQCWVSHRAPLLIGLWALKGGIFPWYPVSSKAGVFPLAYEIPHMKLRGGARCGGGRGVKLLLGTPAPTVGFLGSSPASLHSHSLLVCLGGRGAGSRVVPCIHVGDPDVAPGSACQALARGITGGVRQQVGGLSSLSSLLGLSHRKY